MAMHGSDFRPRPHDIKHAASTPTIHRYLPATQRSHSSNPETFVRTMSGAKIPDTDPFREYPADAPLKSYRGGCHCRKFTFEFDYMADFAVRPPNDCSCSIDSMHKTLWM